MSRPERPRVVGVGRLASLRRFMARHHTYDPDRQAISQDHDVAITVDGQALLCMTCDEIWNLPVKRRAPRRRGD